MSPKRGAGAGVGREFPSFQNFLVSSYLRFKNSNIQKVISCLLEDIDPATCLFHAFWIDIDPILPNFHILFLIDIQNRHVIRFG